MKEGRLFQPSELIRRALNAVRLFLTSEIIIRLPEIEDYGYPRVPTKTQHGRRGDGVYCPEP
jgi:hypothetical protein